MSCGFLRTIGEHLLRERADLRRHLVGVAIEVAVEERGQPGAGVRPSGPELGEPLDERGPGLLGLVRDDLGMEDLLERGVGDGDRLGREARRPDVDPERRRDVPARGVGPGDPRDAPRGQPRRLDRPRGPRAGDGRGR
jgi:hypothetical protein